MPIVDAYASCGRGNSSVREYFDCVGSLHVLRLIVVIRKQELEPLRQNLAELSLQASTPGLGGFPNAVICPCNILDMQSTFTLLDDDSAQLVTGVYHEFVDADEIVVSGPLLDSLDIMIERNLSLDVVVSPRHVHTLIQLAQAKPQIPIIANIDLSDCFNDKNSLGLVSNSMQQLSATDNIHLKLHGAGMTRIELDSALDQHLANWVQQFGDQRIMFGSGYAGINGETKNGKSVSFDELWGAYLEKSTFLSARGRDRVFRTNALSIYLS